MEKMQKTFFVFLVVWNLTIIKINGRAMRALAMANELTLALTRKARLTPARLTMDNVNVKQRNAVNAGFNPVYTNIYRHLLYFTVVEIHVAFAYIP